MYNERILSPEEALENDRIIDEISEIIMHDIGWFFGKLNGEIFNKISETEGYVLGSEMEWMEVLE